MRRASLFSLILLFAGLAPLPLLAQDTGAAKQQQGKSNMSMHDMMGRGIRAELRESLVRYGQTYHTATMPKTTTLLRSCIQNIWVESISALL